MATPNTTKGKEQEGKLEEQEEQQRQPQALDAKRDACAGGAGGDAAMARVGPGWGQQQQRRGQNVVSKFIM